MGKTVHALPIACSLLMVWACVSNQDRIPTDESQQVKNLSLHGFNIWGGNRNDWRSPWMPVDEALRFMLDEGANYISIDWPVAFKDDGHIMADDGGPFQPNRADIETLIDKARSSSFYVLLKPHVCSPGSNDNRSPDNTNVPAFLPANFFNGWKTYLRGIAEMAERKGVNAICIGTELSILDGGNRTKWLDLVNSLRQVFSGDLTYDAVFSIWGEKNWYNDVVFWDALDYLGCSYYIPITRNDAASVEEIKDGFFHNKVGLSPIKDVVKALRSVAVRYKKQVMILESGYTSMSGGLSEGSTLPSPEKSVDYGLQERGLKAYLSVVYENQGDWLKGVSLWGITPGTMTPEVINTYWHTQAFTIYGKPAALTVKEFYSME
jgi:hypothetical protein